MKKKNFLFAVPVLLLTMVMSACGCSGGKKPVQPTPGKTTPVPVTPTPTPSEPVTPKSTPSEPVTPTPTPTEPGTPTPTPTEPVTPTPTPTVPVTPTPTPSVTPVEDVYKVRVNEGEYVVMSDATDLKEQSDTWLKQFKATLTVETSDEVQFVLNDERIYPGASAGNLSYDVSSKALTVKEGGENLDLYLKVYADGYDTWFAAPSPAPVDLNWYVRGTMNEWATAEAYKLALRDEDKPEGADHQYYIKLTLAENDELKFYSNNVWLGFDSLENGGAIAKFSKNNSEGDANNNIIVNEAGSYEFFLKVTGSNYAIYVAK